MKKGHGKTTYFRKDWTLSPPSVKSAKSTKSTKTATTKLAKNLKKAATKASSAAHTTARAISKSTAKLTQNLQASAKAPRAKSPVKSPTRRKSPIKSKTQTKVTRSISPKVKTLKSAAHNFSWREVTLMSMVGTSALAIAFTFLFTSVVDPVKRSERQITKLADSYYIEYLYPRALGNYLDQPQTILEAYAKSGLPAVRLNQLLSYDSGKNASAYSAFSNNLYECDTNFTTVKYYPVEPYGPRDYTIEYTMSCEKLASNLE